MAEWTALTRLYEGWTLTEIQQLTNRERKNWLEVVKIKTPRKE